MPWERVPRLAERAVGRYEHLETRLGPGFGALLGFGGCDGVCAAPDSGRLVRTTDSDGSTLYDSADRRRQGGAYSGAKPNGVQHTTECGDT